MATAATFASDTHPSRPGSAEPLLSVRDLSIEFRSRGSTPFTAVDGVSFDVRPGQTVGLVGESGCGKSVTSLAIMGLLDRRGSEVSGQVLFEGTDLLTESDRAMRDRRGRDLGMIFQDPLSSLNPVVPIGLQVSEVIERHRGLKRRDAMARAREMLDKVGIPDPDRRLKEYPHQLSGGMRQRALIAMALACEPRLLIADEPTTALDVTIQAQILQLLKDLVRDSGTALIMITHDLGVVAGLCDEVNVLYGGRIVERGERHPLFAHPRHPYTTGLLGSIPSLRGDRGAELDPIPGSVVDNLPWSSACAFAPRCSQPIGLCTQQAPELEADAAVADDRRLRCHNPVQEAR
ncbi:ABC transporter ATP-binding protein [Kytococcus sp. Marseille-QA3725]